MARRLITLLPGDREFHESMVARTDNPNECWEWQHELTHNGYGRMRGTLSAHRVAYLLHYGVQPGKLNVLHKCNNPPCCNPHHLYLGNQQQNMQQASREGRMDRNSKRAKLTHDQVREIRNNPHIPLRVFAKRFGVTISTIQGVRKGRTYKYVT